LCVYPWLFHDNFAGPVAERDFYYKVFTTREASNQSSALASKEVRKELLDSAIDRLLFERSLQCGYTVVTLPVVYESIYGTPYRRKNQYGEERRPDRSGLGTSEVDPCTQTDKRARIPCALL